MIMVEQEPRERESKQTVLIVDDEKPLAQAIATTLDLEGLQTAVAYNGEQALELAHSLQPDLILLDVMMPGKSGIEVCATLKADPRTARIPVVFVTAKTEETDCMVGLAVGAHRYLTKPFSPTQLIALVSTVLTGQPIESEQQYPDLSTIPADQLEVYASELKELFERERVQRHALEEAGHRLEEVDRLKAAFLGAVTHELMTPFGAIGLAVEVLQRQSEGADPGLRKALDSLAAEITSLRRLVSGVVKFAELVSKRREPRPRRIALEQLISWAVEPLAVMAQAREVDFQVLMPSDLPEAYADPDLLAEAVFQMAHNAVKFNVPGGRVEVRAFKSKDESKGWLVIEVADTGVGLTPELLKVLGQLFEQGVDALRRGQEGLGIGWSFVRYVAEVHGGQTHAKSPGPGQGSTFSLAVSMAAGLTHRPDAEQ